MSKVFISHNKADKAIARAVGAQLLLLGVDVWFDEWSIEPGDSIPAEINAGLGSFTYLVLIWSANAASSRWVQGELDSATMRLMSSGDARVIPCLLDSTALPPLIAPFKGIDFADVPQGIDDLCNAAAGTLTRKKRLLAIQKALEAMDVEWFDHPELPPLPCCPGCGADTSALKRGTSTDFDHDRSYWWVKCRECGWEEGGEI